MKFKIGDKVKFLNEAGGGIVSKIISSNMVNVAVEDGFDIPVLTGDLLLVNPASYSEQMFDEDFKVEQPAKTEETLPEAENVFALRGSAGKNKEAAGVYLALKPRDQQWLLMGMLDIYLINHTPYDVLYSLSLKEADAKFSGFDYRSIEPESMLLVESIEREQLGQWKEGILQILYHNNRAGQVLLPVHANFKIKENTLNNESAYVESGIIEGRILLMAVNEIRYQQTAFVASAHHTPAETKIEESRARETKEQALIDRHQTLPGMAVVDLHIGELLDNIAGMESRDMFAYQKKYFKDCLDSAIERNYKKVTFIHGVGNGALKNFIIQTLRAYENIENQSASIAKYGVGAIDVHIKPYK